MKFSFKTDMVPDLTFEEVCNTARDYGFSGFEICGIDVSAAVGGLFRPLQCRRGAPQACKPTYIGTGALLSRSRGRSG